MILSRPVKPANRCVRIIWKSWNFSGERHSILRSSLSPFEWFQRGSLRLFLRSNDTGQSETFERHHVQWIYEDLSTLRICCGKGSRRSSLSLCQLFALGKIASSTSTSGHSGDTLTFSQLDSSRLYLRNEHGQHIDRYVLHGSDVSKRHTPMSDGNRSVAQWTREESIRSFSF